MKIEIIKTHIENDIVNNVPKLIYTDANGIEWVNSHVSLNNDGAGISILKKKSDCWYFDLKNKKPF
jgi:hypothetical protein